ncbi:RGG repeats nuclear RNA binding protein A-like [Typha latifolia]|uniref:RGG repeats nuclear RNA binding protein A-like n=1 Tax=Typha latifolia TaxID=4733 RepID=UPI003C2B16AC
MATVNSFDLLGDDENDDPSHLIATHQQKIAAKNSVAAAPAATAAKLPAKPVPPQQAVREAKNTAAPARGVAGRGGPFRGRGGRGGGTGPNRDFANGDANGFTGNFGGGGGGEELDARRSSDRERGGYASQRPSYRGGRRGGYGNGEAGGDSERPQRRAYERRSGTGRGYEVKRDGAGRGNWGTTDDDVLAQVTDENVTNEKALNPEKPAEQEDVPQSEGNKDKEGQANEQEEKEPEEKEMTLEEYEKIREEKRKALLATKAEERKVELDKEFESMKLLSIKKGSDEIFIKLGSDKDIGKKRDNERDERSKKSLSINEFLKPAEGERYYNPGGRGRGRGRGDRGSYRGGFGGGSTGNYVTPSIEDPGQFPTLGGK